MIPSLCRSRNDKTKISIIVLKKNDTLENSLLGQRTYYNNTIVSYLKWMPPT
jgi:hypothetical protein